MDIKIGDFIGFSSAINAPAGTMVINSNGGAVQKHEDGRWYWDIYGNEGIDSESLFIESRPVVWTPGTYGIEW